MTENYKNKEMLYDLYVNQKLSMAKIGKIFNVDSQVIYYHLNRLKIPTRSRSEAVHIALRNQVNLSNAGKEFIYGELLGDMTLTQQSDYSSHVGYASKYREYIEWLAKMLNAFGVEQVGRIRKNSFVSFKNHHSVAYSYGSKNYPELLEIRKMFYPHGKKIIPDIDFTPLVLRQWYIGDGTVGRTKDTPGCRDFIVLNTQGFKPRYVQMATMKLNDMGFRVAYQPANNVIAIKGCSVVDFLDYIGPCPVECYSYKWATKNRKGQLAIPLKN